MTKNLDKIQKLYELADELREIVNFMDENLEEWEQEAEGFHTMSRIGTMIDNLETACEDMEKAGDVLDLIENKMWRLIK